MAAAYDTWFYVVHRLMHTKWLCVSPRLVCSVLFALGWDDYGGGQPSFRYGRSHKLHHTWKAPVVRGRRPPWCESLLLNGVGWRRLMRVRACARFGGGGTEWNVPHWDRPRNPRIPPRPAPICVEN